MMREKKFQNIFNKWHIVTAWGTCFVFPQHLYPRRSLRLIYCFLADSLAPRSRWLSSVTYPVIHASPISWKVSRPAETVVDQASKGLSPLPHFRNCSLHSAWMVKNMAGSSCLCSTIVRSGIYIYDLEMVIFRKHVSVDEEIPVHFILWPKSSNVETLSLLHVRYTAGT